MLTGSVRGVYGGRQHSSFQLTDRRAAAVQAPGRVASGTQVGSKFRGILLVQREVSRHSQPRVPLRGAESLQLRLLRVTDHR